MAAIVPDQSSTVPGDAEASDLEGFIGYNLKRAYMIVHADFRQALAVEDLSARSFSALSLTVKFPNITQSALSRMLGIERSGLVAIVDELEARGYLSRAPVPGDRRVQALVPSKAGKAAYQRALRKVRDHEEALLTQLSPDEKATLLELLGKVRMSEENQ